MTLSIAWVRTLNPNVRELVFASDSRLCGGHRFDHAAKLFTLPRSDCGLAFAGGTSWAYPMATALARATEIHGPSATRALELSAYLAHLIKILNLIQSAVHNFAGDENIPDVTFLFGGWDWISNKFRLWSIKFDRKKRKFVRHERTTSDGFGRLGLIEFAGDDDFVAMTRSRLKKLLQDRFGLSMRANDARFNFEPFEILRDILREVTPDDSVGGAPQLMKVYQHMNTRVQGIYWESNGNRSLHYCGRPLLGYERADGLRAFDPDTLQSHAFFPQQPSDSGEIDG